MADVKKQPFSDSQVLRRNLLVAFVLTIVLLTLWVTIPGYNFVVSDVAIHNKELMDHLESRRLNFNMPEMTTDLKRAFRDSNYWYTKTLQDLPENAVVLLPPANAVIQPHNFKDLNDAEVMEYFLYPRLCISEDDRDKKKELYAKVTHVAIVNGWGYDKLKYTPSAMPSEAVLSIDPPKVDTTRKPDAAMKGFFPQGQQPSYPPNQDQQH